MAGAKRIENEIRDEEEDGEPLTAEERAECDRIARAHLMLVHRIMAASGLGAPRMRSRSSRGRHRAEPREFWQEAGAYGLSQDECGPYAIGAMAQRLLHHCPRPECRRAFACRFAQRAGDRARLKAGERPMPPCTGLPRGADLALRMFLFRKRMPTLFRQPHYLKTEREAINAAKADLARHLEAKMP